MLYKLVQFVINKQVLKKQKYVNWMKQEQTVQKYSDRWKERDAYRQEDKHINRTKKHFT